MKKVSTRVAFVTAVLAIGVVGSLLLVFSHAETPPNCGIIQGVNKNLQFCTTISSFNYLNASATYTGETPKDILTSGSLSLYQCTKAVSPVCSVVASSNSVLKPNLLFGRKYSQLKTSSVVYDQGSVYKSCVTFTATTNLSANNNCTQIVTWGSGAGESPRAYIQVAAQATPPIPTTPNTSTNTTTSSNSTNTKTTQVQPAPAPSCGGQTLTAKADGTQWHCSFNDDFSGTALNRLLWAPQVTATSGFTMGADPYKVCFMDSTKNVGVSGGYLNLSVQKEAQPLSCKAGSKGTFTTSYTGGEVTTYNLFSQQYGRFEVSAKLPATKAKGLQETLWLWPNNSVKYGAWPGSGEVDFGEFYSYLPTYNVPYIHYNYNSYDTATDKNIVTLLSPKYNKNFNNCVINFNAFNTYTLTWRSGFMQIDVNGKPCVVNNYSSTTGDKPAPFDQPFFIALTQALGTVMGNQDNGFDPAVTPLPATTQVDYVRVWK